MKVAIAVLADAGPGGDHMSGWGGGWMWFMGVAMVTLLAVLIVWLIRANSGSGGSSVATTPGTRNPTDRGREILAERYGKGDLTTAEYRERLDEMQ